MALVKDEEVSLEIRLYSIRGQVTRFEQYFNRVVFDEVDPTELELRLKSVETCLARFNEIQLKIEIIQGIYDEKIRASFENKFFPIIAKAKNLLEEKRRTLSSVIH